MSQSQLTEYDRRAADFAHVRAMIMKIVKSMPGLTQEEISKEFLLRYGFLPRIDNRCRELRKIGWIETIKENDGLLHVYPKPLEASK